MDLTRTRTALHGIAELLLAGPQYAASGTIRLRALPAGIATVAAPDLRLEGAELVGPARTAPALRHLRRRRGGRRHHARPSTTSTATGAASTPTTRSSRPRSPGRADRAPRHRRRCAARLRARRGAGALARAPRHRDRRDEVNYGVSPGDASIPEPYAYVGPWTPRTGDFWNASFGAARPLSALGGADAVADFFREGARLAAG